jgi:hypothetical protein
MSKVIKADVRQTHEEKFFSLRANEFEAEVYLDDGRTGKGVSGGFMSPYGSKESAYSRAVADAQSKPLPKK